MNEVIRPEKIKEFLVSLEEDDTLFDDYQREPRGKMIEWGLTEKEADLLLEADSAEIKKALQDSDVMLIIRCFSGPFSVAD